MQVPPNEAACSSCPAHHFALPSAGMATSDSSGPLHDIHTSQGSAPEPLLQQTPLPSGSTALLVHELDWQAYCQNRASHNAKLHPPFDLLLVADVVRLCSHSAQAFIDHA